MPGPLVVVSQADPVRPTLQEHWLLSLHSCKGREGGGMEEGGEEGGGEREGREGGRRERGGGYIVKQSLTSSFHSCTILHAAIIIIAQTLV